MPRHRSGREQRRKKTPCVSDHALCVFNVNTYTVESNVTLRPADLESINSSQIKKKTCLIFLMWFHKCHIL